jgi:hypothetical protein
MTINAGLGIARGYHTLTSLLNGTTRVSVLLRHDRSYAIGS